MQEKKSKTDLISVRVPVEMKEKIICYAKKNDRPLSAEVGLLIAMGMDVREMAKR